MKAIPFPGVIFSNLAGEWLWWQRDDTTLYVEIVANSRRIFFAIGGAASADPDVHICGAEEAAEVLGFLPDTGSNAPRERLEFPYRYFEAIRLPGMLPDRGHAAIDEDDRGDPSLGAVDMRPVPARHEVLPVSVTEEICIEIRQKANMGTIQPGICQSIQILPKNGCPPALNADRGDAGLLA